MECSLASRVDLAARSSGLPTAEVAARLEAFFAAGLGDAAPLLEELAGPQGQPLRHCSAVIAEDLVKIKARQEGISRDLVLQQMGAAIQAQAASLQDRIVDVIARCPEGSRDTVRRRAWYDIVDPDGEQIPMLHEAVPEGTVLIAKDPPPLVVLPLEPLASRAGASRGAISLVAPSPAPPPEPVAVRSARGPLPGWVRRRLSASTPATSSSPLQAGPVPSGAARVGPTPRRGWHWQANWAEQCSVPCCSICTRWWGGR